jgi:ATP-dependent Clp protease protease subunit
MRNLLTLLVFLFAFETHAQAPTYEKVVLNTRNAVTLRGPIDSSSVQKAQFELMHAALNRAKPSDKIYLVLDSPGGSIEDGLTLIEFAKTIPNLSTISIFAASMASAVVEALPGERLLTNNGMLMFHRAAGGFQGQFEDGEVESRLMMAKSIVRSMELVNANRMKMPLGVYKELVVRELWLYSQQAIAYRAADRIVDISCTSELIQTTEKLTIDLFIFSVDLVFSQCPLFRAPLDDKKNIYQVPIMSNFSRWTPTYYQDRFNKTHRSSK